MSNERSLAEYITERIERNSKRADAARATVIEYATKGLPMGHYEPALRQLAEAEGADHLLQAAAYRAERAAARGLDEAQLVTNVITELMLGGAGDDASGRGNDIARARHDGLRDEARAILDEIRYGSN